MQKKKLNLKEYAVWIMLVVLVAVFSLAVPNFATTGNMVTILRQVANIGILSVGMTFVLISGGIDLSIGNQMGLVGVISALLMVQYNVSPVWACIVGLVVGVIVGLINGLLITYTQMPPLIMTLGMSYAARGLAYIITGGYPIYGLPESMKWMGQGYLFGVIPVCVLVMVVVIAIGAFIMNKTYVGRQFYAIGSNEEAARLSGHPRAGLCDRGLPGGAVRHRADVPRELRPAHERQRHGDGRADRLRGGRCQRQRRRGQGHRYDRRYAGHGHSGQRHGRGRHERVSADAGEGRCAGGRGGHRLLQPAPFPEISSEEVRRRRKWAFIMVRFTQSP